MMIRNNLIKKINFLIPKRSFSTSNNLSVYNLTPKQYLLGFSLSSIIIGKYTYYVGMSKERNKYKPYNTMVDASLFGAVISIIWPVTFPIMFLFGIQQEIRSLVDRLDEEYEKELKLGTSSDNRRGSQ